MDKNSTNFQRIYWSDGFEQAFLKYCYPGESKEGDQIKKFANFLTEKKFTIKDAGLTYRIINNWSNLGLFDDGRIEEEKGWRKLNAVDLIWLRILVELRKFGFPLEKMKKGYETLFFPENVGSPSKNKKLLEFGISLCLMRKAIYLIAFSDGCIELATQDNINTSEAIGLLRETSYLVINLNNCLSQLFPKINFQPQLNTFELTDKEVSILSMLRDGDCNEIVVHMKNGDIDRIDTKTKHVGEIGKLADILNKVSHGNFIIKKQDGKIVCVETTKKKKV